MSVLLRYSMLATGACAALLLVGASLPSSPAHLPAGMPARTPDALERPSPGQWWLDSARIAFDGATKVRVPFAVRAELHEAGADVFALEALGGQTLDIELTRDAAAAAPDGRIYVEVFRVVDLLGHALRERLTALRPSASSLTTRLPSDGTYHVLVQADAGSDARYALTLELGPALPFPVVGAEADTIRSLFGASRDSGRRQHEGVDIYVQRLTPVLAVAAGRAMPRHDALGGNTVWLNTPGTSYYYAHLDRVAVREHQRVKPGDVLGYVGNTGNATGMPSHLHFGVYRWGRDPIDPLPLLVGQRFDERAAAEEAAGGG